MIRRAHSKVRLLLKVGLTLAIVIAIALGLLSLEEEPGVPEASADILDLSWAGPRHVTRFENVLEELGHDSPQTYRLNGNTVHFSYRMVEGNRSVQSVLREYQDAFTRGGLNDRPYYSVDAVSAQQRLLTSLAGGVVPQSISNDHIVMGGMILHNRARNKKEILNAFHRGANESTMFRGHRWMEIMREPDTTRVSVIASWSDESFDYKRMLPGSEALVDSRLESDVPTCPGCQRVHHLEDPDRRKTHDTQVFTGSASPRQLRMFYIQAMESRGWALRDETITMTRLLSAVDARERDVLLFEKRDEELEVLLYKTGPQESAVHITRSERRYDR